MAKTISRGALLWLAPLLIGSGAAALTSPARAACLASPLDPTTNCATFTPESNSDVVNRYEVDNFKLNRHFQLGLFTTAARPVTITNLAWSRDGSSWSDFATPSLIAGDETNLSFTNIVSLPTELGDLFHVRYTIPAGGMNPPETFAEGDFVSSQLITNRDRATALAWDPAAMASVPVLKGKPGNRYALVQRDHQDAPSPAPGPLALLGVAAGLRAARQLRRQQAG